MIAVVDIGNTNVVVGLMDDEGKLLFSGRIRTKKGATKEEFTIDLRNLFDVYKVSLDGTEGVIISSVVPEVTDQIAASMKMLTGREAMIVGRGTKTGIKIATDNPASLGTDLVVDAVAACEEYEGTIVIFDMGTATTCSLVEDKTYLGTIIMPGVKISQDALTEKASQLPSIRFDKPKNLIGKNTIESMQSGLIYGNASMVDGMIDRIRKLTDKEPVVIATGGIAKLIVPHCFGDIVYDPDLLLKGLWHIYKKNQ